MGSPVIAVSGRRYLGHRIAGLPENFSSISVDLAISDYARCVAAAGGVPLNVPFEADPHEVMERLDALVLTGGSDVDPRRYHAFPGPNLGVVEPERDSYEIALLEAAFAHDKPVLAICRGAQLLNVMLGGTLVADLASDVGCGHPAWSFPREALVHRVELVPGSLVSQAFGTTELMVNSLHHQSVDHCAPGVKVTGTAPDGVVEAIEIEGRAVLAVQWHPELLLTQPDPCFSWLVGEAKRT